MCSKNCFTFYPDGKSKVKTERTQAKKFSQMPIKYAPTGVSLINSANFLGEMSMDQDCWKGNSELVIPTHWTSSYKALNNNFPTLGH
jgi:hypothetical protein